MTTFVTFGDGSRDFRAAGRRIARQAARTKIFDTISRYDYARLKSDHPDYWRQHRDFILGHRRGGGYWIWKSFIIHTVLSGMKEDDVLLYSDAGCEIDNRLMEGFSKIHPGDCDMTLFELEGHSNEAWTHALTLKALGVNEDIGKLDQLVGTVLLIKNTSSSRSLVQEWMRLCHSFGYALVIDLKGDRRSVLREHRHDQSILSLLARQRVMSGACRINIQSINFIDWDGGGLLACRNKGGYSLAEQSSFMFKYIRKLDILLRKFLPLENRYFAWLRRDEGQGDRRQTSPDH
jgi:hypothetical protein